MDTKRPNILLIVTDQQRWDALGAAGNAEIQTPHLDALAAQGVRFSHAFANHPLCMPSRQSMLSGQYAEAIGSVFNGIEMNPRIPCLQNLLGRAGYHTACIGKLHFLNHNHRNHRDSHPSFGFDTLLVSDEPGCYDDAYIKWVGQMDASQVGNCRVDTHESYTAGPKVRTGKGRFMWNPYTFEAPAHLSHSAFVGDRTRDFLRSRAGNSQPWFCHSGFYAPHPPLNPPSSFLELYDPESLSLPHAGPSDRRMRPDLIDDDLREIKAHYYALVSQVDEQVGLILEELDELEMREETLVIFTSDHGEMLGDHGLWEKILPEDSSSRVPLVVRFPGELEAGSVQEDLIGLVDLAPSILDWAGLFAPTWMQGRSFKPLLEGNGDYEPRRDVYMSLQIPGQAGYKALRSRNWLYVKPTPGGLGGEDLYFGRAERLFDLRQDPWQQENVIDREEALPALHDMRNRLLDRTFDVDSKMPRRTGQF